MIQRIIISENDKTITNIAVLKSKINKKNLKQNHSTCALVIHVIKIINRYQLNVIFNKNIIYLIKIKVIFCS